MILHKTRSSTGSDRVKYLRHLSASSSNNEYAGIELFGNVKQCVLMAESIWNIFRSSLAVLKLTKTMQNDANIPKHILFMIYKHFSVGLLYGAGRGIL